MNCILDAKLATKIKTGQWTPHFFANIIVQWAVNVRAYFDVTRPSAPFAVIMVCMYNLYMTLYKEKRYHVSN